MHVFVMGGARDVVFYRSSIEHMKKAQGTAGIPFFKDDDVTSKGMTWDELQEKQNELYPE